MIELSGIISGYQDGRDLLLEAKLPRVQAFIRMTHQSGSFHFTSDDFGKYEYIS